MAHLPTPYISTSTRLHLFSLLAFCLLPYVNSVYFQISHFENKSTNILYQGDAVASLGTVEFNKVNYLSRVGRVTYAEGVRLWDSGSQKLSDFTTHFSFTIETQGSSSYGHGLAFFPAPIGFQIPPNSVAGFLGLFNSTTIDSPYTQIVAVEFDSYSNPEWDPPYEHVGINNNSIASAITTPWNASFHSGDPADVWITYNATTKNLSISRTYQRTSSPPENSSLSYHIDLMKVLPEWITVGFSAATGKYVERHTLESWEFHSSLETEETNGSNNKKIRLIVGLTIPVGILIAGAIVASLIWCRSCSHVRRETSETMSLTSMKNLERRAGSRMCSYKDLAAATNNFSNQRKLGQGGFGSVYRGFLNDIDMPVAVKKISKGSKQGKKEYITEIQIVSRLRHRNLVELIGWCHDRSEFLLVYEFMPNRSLDYHLFGKRSLLAWSLRYNIPLRLASALLYLHEEWDQCVVHRDIKSSNIMLDTNFNVKLGDFGLARLVDHELGSKTTRLAGTLGYMAPEYISTGKASKESDVFSFGVVALELATGRRSVDPLEDCEVGFVEWAWDQYGRGRILSVADEKLHMDYDVKQLECLMIVGLWSAHPDRQLRASVRQVIQAFNFEAALPTLPNKMPVPTYHVPIVTVSSSDASITYTSLEAGR